MRTIALAVAFLLALVTAVATQQVNTGGVGASSVPLPGTSGGVICYTSTATLASSDTLTASAVIVGGGAGVCPVSLPLITMQAFPSITMVGQQSQSPVISLQNQANDGTGSQFNLNKLRNDGSTLSVQNGDSIATFFAQPYTNGNYRAGGLFGVAVSGAPSGSNVPTTWTWQSTSAAGATNTMTFNDTGLLTVPYLRTATGYTVATLPAASAGSRAYVTNQLTTCAAIGAALTGGGSITCPVFYNGTAWVGG